MITTVSSVKLSKSAALFRSRLSLCSLIITTLLLAAIMGRAQVPMHSSTEPVQVTGQLRYANGGQPANDVIVILELLSGGIVGEVRTDRLGKFKFANLAPVQYHILIRQPGYQEIQREVNLIMTSAEYLQLSLVPASPSNSSRPPPSNGVVDANVTPEARKEYSKAEALLATTRKERIPEAIQHLEAAVSFYRNFLEAYLKLGVAYMDLQQWEKAEAALRRALEINPKTANALFALGEVYWRENQAKLAEQTLQNGLAIENRSWRGHFTLGRLYWSRGEIAKAGRQVALAIQLNPNFADAHLLAGDILLRADKRDDAIAEFHEYLRLAPKGEFAAQVRATLQKLEQTSSRR